jgi:hypothetical protein
MKKLKRLSLLILILLFLIASPVLAISNPDSIAFGLYGVYENAAETGDMLIIAEGIVEYTVEPTDYDADEAFIFELLNTAGNVTLASTTLNDYGDRPVSMYLSASQVTALGLVSGTGYKLRIMGNPLVFPTPTGNSVNLTLSAEDYIDQSDGADSSVPTDNELRNFIIQMARNIEDYDTPTDDYLTVVQGYKYLTIAGADIFIEAIPNITTICSVAFQAGLEVMSANPPESTGAYALTLTPENQWGTTVANGLTNLGLYLGINQALAGSVVLLIVAIAFAMFVYQKTESGMAVLLLIFTVPFFGAWLGLMPMALAFIAVIFVIVLLGYFFFSRGAL